MTERTPLTIRYLVGDAAWLVAATVVAFAAGVAGDQLFRASPLGLQYRSAGSAAVQASGSESQTSIRFIGIEEVDELRGLPDVVIIDARPREIYELGHIPGARSLSRERFSSDFAELEPVLRDSGQTIVVYCADLTCPDGALVARNLQEQGLSKVVVFEGGYDEWESSGRPVESAL